MIEKQTFIEYLVITHNHRVFRGESQKKYDDPTDE